MHHLEKIMQILSSTRITLFRSKKCVHDFPYTFEELILHEFRRKGKPFIGRILNDVFLDDSYRPSKRKNPKKSIKAHNWIALTHIEHP